MEMYEELSLGGGEGDKYMGQRKTVHVESGTRPLKQLLELAGIVLRAMGYHKAIKNGWGPSPVPSRKVGISDEIWVTDGKREMSLAENKDKVGPLYFYFHSPTSVEARKEEAQCHSDLDGA